MLQLIEDFKIGGLERVVANIFDGLDRNRFDISLWCIARGGSLATEFISKKKDIKILNLRTYHNPLNILKLAFLIRSEKFHIVHAHGYFANTIGRISAILANTPIIISHIHTTNWGFKKRHLYIEKILSTVTDKIICCSNAVYDFIAQKEKINAKKILVIYNGLHWKIGDNDLLVSSQSYKKEIKIVAVASLVENKGHKVLLKAMEMLSKKVDWVKLLIVGDGPLRNELENLAKKLKINDYVFFLGLISDVKSIIKNSDIVVLPTISREGLGMSIIEGMCMGKPVIGSNIGGIPEMIEDGINGYLFPAGNYIALYEKLKILVRNDDLRLEMGKEGRIKYKQKFQAERMINEVGNLYNKLILRKIKDKNI